MLDNDKIQTAQQLIMRVAQGDFEAVEQSLESSVKQQLPAEKLRATWQSLVAQVGSFKEQVEAHTFQIPSAELVIVTCAFANASLDINVAFNDAGEIIGLNITPVGSVEQQFTAKYEAPDYVNQEMFKEQEVEIGGDEWKLRGTLSLPVGDGPFAAVLLVHGSGPNDRDETIGPNKPFRDIAWGLASQGIAVLRYDKRTKVYGEKMKDLGLIATISVKEEVVDDVLAAVALMLHSIPQLNPQRIFVLGHSLGGYLAPRIGAAEDTILDQFTYIYSLSGTSSAEQLQELDKLKMQVARVKDPGLSLSTPASYNVPGHVTEEVINDIAQWVKHV